MSHTSPVGSRTRRRLVASILGAAALAAVPASALAVTRSSEVMKAASDRAARVFFDSRSADRASVRQVQTASRAAGSRVRAARAAELKRLGAGGKLEIDALTGTPRSFQNFSGALSGSTGGSPASVAMGFARSHAAILGLSSADLDALGAPKIVTSPSGISSVRFAQSYKGVPAYDNDLRINLDRVNRVLSVTGSPVHDLSVDSVAPKLSATQALSALMRHVGVRHDLSVKSASSDARRSTTFSNGDLARLVLFHGKSGSRLAWHLMYSATSQAVYDAIVDASSGAILRRANMVKNIDGSVFENYPGDAAGTGGTQQTVSLDPYLTSTTILDGPFARTYLDLNDDNAAGAGEEVIPGPYAFDPFTNAEAPNSFCLALKPCAWDPNTAPSWVINKNEAAVQAHYYVSKYHDHLLAAPIGFGAGDGNFEGADHVVVNADDGATTDTTGGDAGGPDVDHIDNANMSTPPDGSSPLMQMYLFHDASDATDPFRGINGDDDARIVYHEYTHGLSNRLVTSDGFGAVSSPQAGAMGEAWGDWYGMDFLMNQGLETDTAASGEINMGEYSDGVPNSIRFQPMDCPPNGGGAACPGGVDTGPGGFTYADFGHVCCESGVRPEVHSDGEIWAQTLLDLRTAVGSAVAERIVTDGMRLSPPEPSFLDMRNAIIAADAAAPGTGANRNAIWTVFAARGMGFYASAADGSDTTPVANFDPPPPPGTPTGSIAGRLTDVDTGLPIPGALVGVAGHITDPSFPDYLAATTGADGRYSIPRVPQGTYPVLAIPPAVGYDPVKLTDVAVPAGGTAVRNAALKRDWAGFRGGADISGNDDTGADFGCGELGLIDQTLGVGYSPFSPAVPAPDNPHPGEDPFAVVELPKAITVENFAVDPGNTCGDNGTAETKDYTIETSRDGVTFSVAKEGAFVPADAHRLNLLAPTANATNVKFVKITSHSAQGEAPGDHGQFFWDLSEMEVYGNSPNVLPSGTLAASPSTVAPGATVTLTASFTDADSAITGYDWDFDGNGSVDRTTPGPTTTTSYSTAGNRLVKVAVRDFRGGAGHASTTVNVTSTTHPKPALPVLTLKKSGTKGKLTYKVRCFAVCKVSAKLKVARKTARKLGLKSRTVGSSSRTIRPGATRTVTVKLSRKVIRAMRRHHVRKLKAALKVTATYADGRRKTATKKVRIRR